MYFLKTVFFLSAPTPTDCPLQYRREALVKMLFPTSVLSVANINIFGYKRKAGNEYIIPLILTVALKKIIADSFSLLKLNQTSIVFFLFKCRVVLYSVLSQDAYSWKSPEIKQNVAMNERSHPPVRPTHTMYSCFLKENEALQRNLTVNHAFFWL